MNVLRAKQRQLEAVFNGLQDKRREVLSQIIQKVNAVLDFDGTLLNFFLDRYSYPTTLSQEVQYEELKQLLQFYCEHLSEIEQASVEKHEGSLDGLIAVAEGNSNYRSNCYNIGRYLRQKGEHYQKCLQKHCKIVGEERVLSADAVLPFLRDFFIGHDFQLNVQSGRSEPFFSSAASVQTIQQLLEDYSVRVKKMQVGSGKTAEIAEEEILDLIECWIRLDGKLVTRYNPRKSRHQERKEKELIKEAFQEPETNYIPQRISAEDEAPPNSNTVEIAHKASKKVGELTAITNDPTSTGSPRAKEKMSEIELSVHETIAKYETMLTKNPTEAERVIILNTILNLDRQLKLFHNEKLDFDGQPSLVISPSKPTDVPSYLTSSKVHGNPESATTKLEEIFYIYCRKRYISSKHTTFDDIERQTRTMNFEKFYGLCHDFGLVQEAERETLRWSFKKHAKNLSEIDYLRFGKILEDLFREYPLKKEPFEQRILSFKNDWSLGKHSSVDNVNYSFRIVPHSGKTEDEIRQQLLHRRQVKSTQRQQHHIKRVKMEVQYLKKMGLNKQAAEVISRTNKKSSPAFNLDYLMPVEKQPEKLTITNLEKFKDRHFDPRTFVDDCPDEYLMDYRLPQPTKYHKMTRGLSETRVRDLDLSERSREQAIIEGIDRNLQSKVTRGLRAVLRTKRD